MIARLKAWLREWLGKRLRVPPRQRRDRVTPHQNSFAFRRELLRDIHRELREANWRSSGASCGTSL